MCPLCHSNIQFYYSILHYIWQYCDNSLIVHVSPRRYLIFDSILLYHLLPGNTVQNFTQHSYASLLSPSSLFNFTILRLESIKNTWRSIVAKNKCVPGNGGNVLRNPLLQTTTITVSSRREPYTQSRLTNRAGVAAARVERRGGDLGRE
jgi:hypothetical protein